MDSKMKTTFYAILATELIDFSRTGPNDDVEDEPGNPWDDSTTPVGSHFGESGDRIRSAKLRGKTTTINKPYDQVEPYNNNKSILKITVGLL